MTCGQGTTTPVSKIVSEAKPAERLAWALPPRGFDRPAADLAIGAEEASHALVVERFSSTPLEVRAALSRLHASCLCIGLSEEDGTKLDIVLAEVLNNVVEHAYQDDPTGWICVEIEPLATVIAVRISDGGNAMHAGKLPEPQSHRLDVPDVDLPEGGFGWALIHELTSDLSYVRDAGRNRLSLCLRRDLSVV